MIQFFAFIVKSFQHQSGNNVKEFYYTLETIFWNTPQTIKHNKLTKTIKNEMFKIKQLTLF